MRTVGVLGSLCLLAAAASARAAAGDGSVDVQRLRPSSSPHTLGLDSGALAPPGTFRGKALLRFEDASLSLYRDGERVNSLLDDRLALDVTVAYGVLDRLEVGVYLPVVLSQSAQVGGEGFAGGGDPVPLSSFGLADPAIAARFQVTRAADAGLDLALSASATAPASGGADFLGEPHATFLPRVGLGRPIGDRAWVGLDVGYRAREDRDDFVGLPVGDEFTFGAGGALRLAGRVVALAEISGATLASDPGQPVSTPLEALLAGHVDVGRGVGLLAGGGAGLTPAYGTPLWRAFLGVTLDTARRAPPVACESGPEDLDGFADEDGCADLDDDGDGIADADDRCPDTAGGAADADRDGCPDGPSPAAAVGALSVDRDGDGIPDGQDLCVEDPEDPDGFQDDDGCSDFDNDNDGIPDGTDRCPNSAETVGGKADRDGCPDLPGIPVPPAGTRGVGDGGGRR